MKPLMVTDDREALFHVYENFGSTLWILLFVPIFSGICTLTFSCEFRSTHINVILHPHTCLSLLEISKSIRDEIERE